MSVVVHVTQHPEIPDFFPDGETVQEYCRGHLRVMSPGALKQLAIYAPGEWIKAFVLSPNNLVFAPRVVRRIGQCATAPEAVLGPRLDVKSQLLRVRPHVRTQEPTDVPVHAEGNLRPRQHEPVAELRQPRISSYLPAVKIDDTTR